MQRPCPQACQSAPLVLALWVRLADSKKNSFSRSSFSFVASSGPSPRLMVSYCCRARCKKNLPAYLLAAWALHKICIYSAMLHGRRSPVQKHVFLSAPLYQLAAGSRGMTRTWSWAQFPQALLGIARPAKGLRLQGGLRRLGTCDVPVKVSWSSCKWDTRGTAPKAVHM